MRLAFIHPFFLHYARGIERYTANLASALTRAGAQVDILTWRWSHPLVWDDLDPAVRVRTVPTPRYFSAWFVWFFYGIHLLRQRYDHVFVYFADYGEQQVLNLLKSQAFSVVLHFPYSQVPHRYHALAQGHLFERARPLIAVSDFVAREMQAYAGRNCEVIPHGVDAARFHSAPGKRASLRHDLGISPDAPVILSVCALEMRKGVQHVLRALPIVVRSVPGVQYWVVGEGPDAEPLQQFATELGLNGCVHFVPATPDVHAYYQLADVFAIPATGEASSLVTLEALSSELPVIASNKPPFDELIQPQWGCQVDEEDPVELAAALVRLLTDEEGRVRMGKAGRQHILRHHDWSTVAARYLRLLG